MTHLLDMMAVAGGAIVARDEHRWSPRQFRAGLGTGAELL